MNTLDRYILGRFLKNFISSFLILVFIFIFYTIWFLIEELAGKGLDLGIATKFILFYMPSLMPIVLHLTIILASIMTFGALAENYELAAMKSSGVSLFRAMRSCIIFMALLSIGTYFFANNVTPRAQQKSYNLRKNVAKLKPALAISEGIFNDIGNVNIKVDNKHGSNDELLENVIIHKKSKNNVNTTVIQAKTGELVSNDNSDFLQLILRDGHYYEDVQTKNAKNRQKLPHAKAEFEQYIMNIDLSELNNVDLEDEGIKNYYKMQNISQLKHSVDSIRKDNKKVIDAFHKNVHARTGIISLDKNVILTNADSLLDTSTPLLSIFPNATRQRQLVDIALNNITNIKNTVTNKKDDLLRRNKLLNVHMLVMQEKYSVALACLILFFVAAPLGAIIRKGGMGLPMVIAIILFLTYYFTGIFIGNNSKNGGVSPVLGSWVSTIIMLPIGILLTKRATEDKAFFDIDGFLEPLRKLFKKKEKAVKTLEN